MNRIKAGSLLAAATFLVASCGSSPTTTASAGPTTSAGGSAGSITVSGSSTVEPITARVAEAFNAAHPEIGMTVEGPGTGDGFARFCAGETDISDASRPINTSEVAVCEAAGIQYVELHIATDGITVITSPDNADVSCLSYGDMYALVGPESEGFANWNDADALAVEVGGTGGFPAAPLVITAPGEESGTYDTFVELVLADLAEERGADVTARADYQASANDNVIVDNVAANPTSFGWVGFAFFEENTDALKPIEVDGGGGCTAPGVEAIASFEYPLSRPLFIYISLNRLAENPALGEFIDYYLSDEGLGAVSEAGYVQIPASDLDETRAAWETSK
ncbi:MAG: phosphate ABC transporter substrate-binding protein PstS family protein [Acidimicrobiia bacterium]